MKYKISNSELEVMRALWDKKSAMSSAEINEILKQEMGWEKSTVRTLVYRLVDKGILIQEKREMFYYIPAITEEDYMKEQTKTFIEKIYKGNVKNLIASLFEQDYVKSEDIDELKVFWGEGTDDDK